MEWGQKYGFVHVDTAQRPDSTLAHELGHGAFRLDHVAPDYDPDAALKYTDPENIMAQGGQAKWRLRKWQWDQIQRAPGAVSPP